MPLILVAVIGCGGPPPPPAIDPTVDRMAKIAGLYVQAGMEKKGPITIKGEPDLKAMAKKRGLPDEIWVSPNDGKPFVIVWGIDFSKPGSSPPIVVHEKEGKDGKLWATDMMIVSTQMTEAELNKSIKR